MKRLTKPLYLATAIICLFALLAHAQDAGPVLQGAGGVRPAGPERLPPVPATTPEPPAAPTPARLPPGSDFATQPNDVTLDEVLPEHGDTARLWWQPLLAHRLRPQSEAQAVSVQTLVLDALQHSLHVQSIQQPVYVAAEEIIQAEAEFDIHAFIESKFIDTSDPVGNTLLTGGPDRLNEHDWQYEAGIRKKTMHGGSLELGQRLGHKNSNSLFFVPQDQGSAQLMLNFTQPLLNGAGRVYNESLMVLAHFDTQMARDRYCKELQDHLLTVTESYWNLFASRGLLLQKQQHLRRAQEILEELEHRIEIDALESQIVRARAAVASRRAELARAETAVRNVESRLRVLINSPELCLQRSPELLPLEMPFADFINVQVPEAIQVALVNRPEIDEAMQRVRAACTRLNMSRNELLPSLNLVLESYVSGLEGNSSISGAIQRQFDTGAPSYTAGLVFETPIYRRAAHARHRQRWARHQQATLEFQSTMETLTAEVEIAVRDVHTSHREMQAKFEAMAATVADVRYLRQRWQLLPGDDRSAGLLLEDILTAQDRLMEEESSFLRAQVNYAKSIARLRRAMGTLMNMQAAPLQSVAPHAAPLQAAPVQTAPQPSPPNSPADQVAAPQSLLRNVSLKRLPTVVD